jgi:hypothetical protein
MLTGENSSFDQPIQRQRRRSLPRRINLERFPRTGRGGSPQAEAHEHSMTSWILTRMEGRSRSLFRIIWAKTHQNQNHRPTRPDRVRRRML